MLNRAHVARYRFFQLLRGGLYVRWPFAQRALGGNTVQPPAEFYHEVHTDVPDTPAIALPGTNQWAIDQTVNLTEVCPGWETMPVRGARRYLNSGYVAVPNVRTRSASR